MADSYIGEIKMFAGNYAPNGWMTCDGQILPLSRYTALFSILGTMYGGDGKSNFALPNLNGRVPMQYGQGPGLSDRTQGEMGGGETVTLLQTEIPSHTHTPQGGGTGTTVDPTGAGWGATGRTGTYIYGDAANVQMHPNAMQLAGQSAPHNNMQPYLATTFIICIEGAFPPRE